jgi:hypothetical protein
MFELNIRCSLELSCCMIIPIIRTKTCNCYIFVKTEKAFRTVLAHELKRAKDAFEAWLRLQSQFDLWKAEKSLDISELKRIKAA